MVLVIHAWRAWIDARLSGAACLVLCWGSRRSLSAWTCKRVTEDSRVLMLSSIWSIWTDPALGASFPALSAYNSWLSSSSYYSLALDSEPWSLSHWASPSYASASVSLTPLIVSGRPTQSVNMPVKGRVRTSRYCSATPAGGSLILGRLSAASYMKLVGAGCRLAIGGSTGGGLCQMAGETCALRLALGTTCVAQPKTNPAWSLSAPLPGDAQRQLPTIWCLGDVIAIWCDGPRSLMDSELSQPARNINVFFLEDSTMAAQFGQALLASLLALAFGTGASLARFLLWEPPDVRLDGPLRSSLAGAQFRSCTLSGVWTPSRWRKTLLVSHYFSIPLRTTSRRSWL